MSISKFSHFKKQDTGNVSCFSRQLVVTAVCTQDVNGLYHFVLTGNDAI